MGRLADRLARVTELLAERDKLTVLLFAAYAADGPPPTAEDLTRPLDAAGRAWVSLDHLAYIHGGTPEAREEELAALRQEAQGTQAAPASEATCKDCGKPTTPTESGRALCERCARSRPRSGKRYGRRRRKP